MMSKADLERHLNTRKWTISNRTKVMLPSTITGVAFSPVREHCIVLYTKLPEEVGHLHFPIRRKTLEALGITEPDEGWEEGDYPVILVNKMYGARNMSEMNKYSFYRNFRKTAQQANLDIKSAHSAYHLIGRKLVSNFVQMRKLNTDIRFWATDRIGIGLK